jgi:hypothetical protein
MQIRSELVSVADQILVFRAEKGSFTGRDLTGRYERNLKDSDFFSILLVLSFGYALISAVKKVKFADHRACSPLHWMSVGGNQSTRTDRSSTIDRSAADSSSPFAQSRMLDSSFPLFDERTRKIEIPALFLWLAEIWALFQSMTVALLLQDERVGGEILELPVSCFVLQVFPLRRKERLI